MTHRVRRIEKPCEGNAIDSGDAERLREWIVTNGLGGYASGTVCGYPTRRYHGLLIAALAAPLGRTMLLSHVEERLVFPDGKSILLGGEPLVTRLSPKTSVPVTEFRLEEGLPVWSFQVEGMTIERRLVLPHLQNTVYLNYTLSGPDLPTSAEQGKGNPIQLVVRPLVHFRSHDDPVNRPQPGPYRLSAWGDRYEVWVSESLPTLRMTLRGNNPAFTLDAVSSSEIFYQLEAQRGYESVGEQWSPGFFHADLTMDHPVSLVASAESWETLLAMSATEALRREHDRRAQLIHSARWANQSRLERGPQTPGLKREDTSLCNEVFGDELVLAADQFLITPTGRVEDAARAHASGEEVRTVIAGYHWFTDWGRDTMISLEGLTLCTGRAEEAGYILRTFAHYIRNGLIPNMFPEGSKDGVYHTADATLWFFHAIDRYVQATGDGETLRSLVPRLMDIVEHHLRGTSFGIGVDPEDGLLRQGAPGYQLTWMDAKVGDWVVTPRRGKAVEINALWYNALRLLEGWVREIHGEEASATYARLAERTSESFNHRFWYEEGGYLYDVVDGESGDDSACRPNQIFALSLRHPVLISSRWKPTLDVVKERLLTPLGLRSLAPGHPDYKARYFGDLRARDAAYHQGTVWAWLIGPFIDAWLRVYPDARDEARQFLSAFVAHLDEAGLGTISEIFDAEAPYTARGCISQAWSVAEVLRSWVKLSGASFKLRGQTDKTVK